MRAPPETARHPAELLEAESAYLVRWGRREVLVSASASIAALAVLGALGALWSPLVWLLIAPVLPLGALLVLFFRNPGRRIPETAGVLLAPADGRVVEVSEVEEPEYIGGPARKVGIFLSIFDVHLNRAPCSGRVEHSVHRPGRHLDARDPRSARENESQAIGIRREEAGGPEGLKVLVRQISGAIARRIVCPLNEGQDVARGRLIGMIKYGSRTEICVPGGPGAPLPRVRVKVGDRVVAGETVVFEYPLPEVGE